jgi:hypothetical protein
MRLIFSGAVLFAFIPLVLFLYLRQPLGPAVSILIGVVIMFGHRFVAAPWMARHSTERCLWCGKTLREVTEGPGRVFRVSASGRDQPMAACSARHHEAAARFLTFVTRWRAPIAIGIFVPLLLLLVGSLAPAAGHPFISHEWNTWQFRTIVAVSVVVTSLVYRIANPVEPLRSPFPLHNLFLLGIRNTLWVFRLVGAWWLVTGIWQLVRR